MGPLDLGHALVIAAAAGVLLLLVALLLWARRRRKRAGAYVGFDLAVYRGQNPGFVHALQAIADSGMLQELSRRGDVRAAFRLLKERSAAAARRRVKRDRWPSLLERPSPVDQRVEAAMLTVLRAVYMDEGLYRAVPVEARLEIDRYLDGLTG